MADNTVWERGDYHEDERLAAGAITPGDAVEVDSNDEYARYGTDGEDNPRYAVAIEDESNPNQGIDDDYSADNPVRARYPYPGAHARVMFAANEDIAVGDEVVINASGKFRELNTAGGDTVNAVVGRAVEANTATTAFRAEVEFY